MTDRFVGFAFLPHAEAFLLQSFEETKNPIDIETDGKYAHCVVAKSVNTSVSSFVLFAMCTDSKYDHKQILQRWSHIERQLSIRGITAIRNGADGAGPFLKAVTIKVNLFNRELTENVY